MQLFRFMAAIVLVVSISLIGIALEKRHLSLTRAISLQQYRTDQLLDREAHLQLRIQELSSPASRIPLEEPTSQAPDTRMIPGH